MIALSSGSGVRLSARPVRSAALCCRRASRRRCRSAAGDELSSDDQGLAGVLAALRRNLVVLLLVAVPVLGVVTAYAETRPPVYTAETTLSFTPRLGSSVGADVVRLVLPRYVAYLAAPTTVRRVAGGTDLPAGVVGGALDASVQTDTANLTITVKLGSPEQAADVANSFADAALVYARGDELLDAQLVAAAVPPSTPSGPPRRLLEAAGLVAALVLGVAAALARERLRPRVLSAGDLERAADAPVLGRLPTSGQLARGATVEVSDPLIGPAVRAAWLQLERAGREQPPRTLAVTSPGSGNGKTTLTTALGAAAARAGRRVVLLDADVQQAGLTFTLGPFRGPALEAALRSAGPVDGQLHEGPVDGVRVLPGDLPADDVTALHRGLPALLGRLREASDLVLLDCPPLQDEDGRTAVATADGVVLVVAAGTPRQQVEEAVAVLRGLGLRLVGTVLNGGRAPGRVSGYRRPSIVADNG